MKKQIVCTCGNVITFEGIIPDWYTCGKCGEKIKVKDKNTVE